MKRAFTLMELAVVIAIVAILVGLGVTIFRKRAKVDTTMEVQTKAEGRVKIERIGVFADGLAYDGKRGIYLIHDNATGRDYIGISGIGISEIGSHTTGRTTVQDER